MKDLRDKVVKEHRDKVVEWSDKVVEWRDKMVEERRDKAEEEWKDMVVIEWSGGGKRWRNGGTKL